MIDKPTLRANALAAMRAAVACEWAVVIMGAELRKQEKDSTLFDDCYNSIILLKMQVDDELSKCHEALTQLYAQSTT